MMQIVKVPSLTAIRKTCFSGILISLVALSLGYGQQLAFPGAQGYGQYATGGDRLFPVADRL